MDIQKAIQLLRVHVLFPDLEQPRTVESKLGPDQNVDVDGSFTAIF